MIRFDINTIGLLPVSFILSNLFVMGPAQEVTFLVDTTDYLVCNGKAHNNETYLWTDISTNPNITLFIVGDEVEKTEEARENDKYDNFDIISQFPFATTLKMTSISLEDRGTYACELLLAQSTVESYVVQVEAEPLFVDISCTSSDDCTSSPLSPSSSHITCTCKADGVFPNTLTFTGNDEAAQNKVVTPTSSGPEGSFDVSSAFELSPQDSTDGFKCSLKGYRGDVNIRRTMSTYTFRPPNCALEVTEDRTCTAASLTCRCHNGIPDVTLFTFYDEAKELIGDPADSNAIEVPLGGDLSTFYCRGCNGVNYEFDRLASDYADCRSTQSPVENSGPMFGPFWIVIITTGMVIFLIFA